MDDFLSQLLVNQAVSIILPLLVGIVTTRLASGGMKAAILALLAGVSGLLNEALASGLSDFNWTIGGLLALFAWIQAIGVYYGFLKPTGMAPAVQRTTENFGVGPAAGKLTNGR